MSKSIANKACAAAAALTVLSEVLDQSHGPHTEPAEFSAPPQGTARVVSAALASATTAAQSYLIQSLQRPKE